MSERGEVWKIKSPSTLKEATDFLKVMDRDGPPQPLTWATNHVLHVADCDGEDRLSRLENPMEQMMVIFAEDGLQGQLQPIQSDETEPARTQGLFKEWGNTNNNPQFQFGVAHPQFQGEETDPHFHPQRDDDPHFQFGVAHPTYHVGGVYPPFQEVSTHSQPWGSLCPPPSFEGAPDPFYYGETPLQPFSGPRPPILSRQ